MSARPEPHQLADGGPIPNSHLPLLLWRAALPADPRVIEQRFAVNNWGNSWRDGIYPFHHFHSIAHEVLGIARGQARVLFGGPSGTALEVAAGDVVAIPAGVGHCRLAASADLLVVGAYPGGAEWDLRRGAPEEAEEVRRNIARVPLPENDPVDGAEGSLLRLWRGA
jgi:uncharacterized protein YjlB